MTVHRATCEDCSESYTDPDLGKVSEWAEDHQRSELHDADIERAVATDGGQVTDGTEQSLHQQYEPEKPIHQAVNITSRMLKDRIDPYQHDEFDLWKARDPETGRESDHWWDTAEEAVEFLAHTIDLDLCCVNECDNYLGEDADRIMCEECHPDEYVECAEEGCDYPTNHIETDYCSHHTWRNGRQEADSE